MATGQKVAVTVDGVVIDWMKGLRSHVGARLRVAPRHLTPNVSWNLSEWGVDDPTPYLRNFLTSPMAARVDAIGGAAEGLAQMRDAGMLVQAVTRRQHMVGDDGADQSKAHDITLQWFNDHPELGVEAGDVVFTNDPVSVDADIWIDNAPRRVERLIDADRSVWVLPQPWNRSVQTRTGVNVLFDGWDSVGDLIAKHTG